MKNSRTTLTFSALVLALCLVPPAAQAHPGHGGGFSAGVTHPLMGLDHLLAMIAVGLWAAQLGGRARWAVPGAFLTVMIAGSVSAATGLHLPIAESAILTSVMLFGLLVLTALRVHLPISVAAVGAFAFFHGLAHGAEIPADASALLYTCGFVLATATLLGLGLAAASVSVKQPVPPVAVRFAGAVIAVCGAILIAQ